MAKSINPKYDKQSLSLGITQLSQDIETERAKLMTLLDNGLTSQVVLMQSQKLDKLITRYTGFKLKLAQSK